MKPIGFWKFEFNTCRNHWLDRSYHTETTKLHPLKCLFSRTTWVSRQQKGNHSAFYWSKRWWSGSGISWTICKLFAPRSRQITTPVPHHSVFTGRMPFLPPNQQSHRTEGSALNCLQCFAIQKALFKLCRLYFIVTFIVLNTTSIKCIACINPNMVFLLQSANTKHSLILQYYNACVEQAEQF